MKKKLILLTLLLLSFWLQAQKSIPLWVHTLDAKSGLSENTSFFNYQDSDGFEWVGSIAGLNRFDSKNVVQYRSVYGDSTTLYDENIQSNFFEDNQKDLWFCTYEAIHCYRREKDEMEHFFVKDANGKGIKEGYRVFFLEQDSVLWIKTGDDIYTFNTKQLEGKKVGTNKAFRNQIITDSSGEVRYLYDLGRQQSDYSYWEIRNGKIGARRKWLEQVQNRPSPKILNEVFWESESVFWMATDLGLIRWNRETEEIETYSIPGSRGLQIVPYGEDDFIVLALGKGVFLFDKIKREYTPFQIRNLDGKAVSTSAISFIRIDHENNLWLTVRSAGLAFANLNKNKFYTHPKPPSSNGSQGWVFQCIEESQDKNLWYGTRTDGLFLADSELQVLANYRQEKDNPYSLPSNWISCLQLMENGDLLIGTIAGLAWLENKSGNIYQVNMPDGKKNSLILDFLPLQNTNSFLVSTYDQGVLLLDEDKNLKKVWFKSGEGYTTLFQDHKNQIYISRNDIDIGVFDWQKDQLVLKDSIALSGTINGFLQTGDDALWIASGSGLAKVNPEQGQFVPVILDQKNGLPDKYICGVLADEAGGVWVSTQRGLARIEEDKEVQLFGLADGSGSLSFEPKVALKKSDKSLYFGGEKGLTLIPARLPDVPKKDAKMVLTRVLVNDEESEEFIDQENGITNITRIKKLSFPYNQNTLSFYFTLIDYSDPGATQLRYQLKGQDGNWVQLKRGEDGFARYANLPAGEYTFWVEGANSEGHWSSPKQLMEVHINPPFYKTWWFRLLVLLALMFVGYALFRYRIAQVEEKAALNTRIAENKMEALRSQMNPHFIFNSLQTVVAFITRKDDRGAIDYINQFAQLMRTVIENSRDGMISLEREIELLELYMKIEARRFNSPFTHTINVGSEVDTYDTEIPSMLLQPFVENAIKHGLFHKKENGHLIIGFLKETEGLKCYVEDNGVGRKKSSKLNQQVGRTHTSRGLQIVEERIEIIKKTNPGKYSFQIIDLYDQEQNPAGTRVEILLPFLD